MPHICVECGEAVDSLYVEFSEGNIRLMRCEQCGNVSDKYIEYELILVAIDLILHRKQAFRHLLYNRQEFESSSSIRLIVVGVIVVNCVLKLSLLHRTVYRNVFQMKPALHLVISSIVEHGVLLAAVMTGLWLIPNTRHLMDGKNNKFKRKVYVALAVPEIFKFAAILVQIFDTDPKLLLLIGLLIVSIQHKSLQSVVNLPIVRLNLITIAAVLLRFLVRCLFHRLDDIAIISIL